MTETLTPVKLKNGSKGHGPTVNITMSYLEKLTREDMPAFYELVALCRDRDHKVWGNVLDRHEGLVTKTDDGYQVHDSIRDIVVSAVTGEDADMALGDPRERSSKHATH